MPKSQNPIFFRFQGVAIRHVMRHQDIVSDFAYIDGNTGHEFDVRDLPDEVVGALRPAVDQGDLIAHRTAIVKAIEAGVELRRQVKADA